VKKYDIVIGKQFGIINGEKNIVFIKTGRGGTIEDLKNMVIHLWFPPILKIRYVIWRKK